MRLLLALAAVSVLLTCCAPGQDPSSPLVRIASRDYGDDKNNIVVEEITRGPHTSRLKLTYDDLGSSVGSSMFIMRGVYEVSKARGFEYFINLKEWEAEDGARIYVIGFTNQQNADIHKEYGTEYSLTNNYGQPISHMSVSECDLLWGNERTTSNKPDAGDGL